MNKKIDKVIFEFKLIKVVIDFFLNFEFIGGIDMIQDEFDDVENYVLLGSGNFFDDERFFVFYRVYFCVEILMMFYF